MGVHHRKLLPQICEIICHVKDSGSSSCSSDCRVCLKICLSNPQFPYYLPPPPSPPSFYLDDDEHHHHTISSSTYLILALALLGAAFFVVCCSAIYIKLCSKNRGAVSSREETEETHDDFLDEEHGPVVVDHPIWYIRTTGLHQSIIKAIAVCKYKKGEGLIEGTECSVCLSEFQEGESVRLLPKCDHAFHLPCIDTWLNSHTNCPLCRAPIVTDPTARVPSMESVVVELEQHAQMEILGNGGESGGGMENYASDSSELRIRAEEEGQLEVEDGARVCETEGAASGVVNIGPNRSVSLDSSSVANINLAAIGAILPMDSNGNSHRMLEGVLEFEPGVSKRVTGNENLATVSKGSSSFRSMRYLRGVPSSMKRSRSYNGKYLLSLYGRSQKKPNAHMRSFSVCLNTS